MDDTTSAKSIHDSRHWPDGKKTVYITVAFDGRVERHGNGVHVHKRGALAYMEIPNLPTGTVSLEDEPQTL